MGKIIEILNKKAPLVSDGAWGTFLHSMGLKPEECPESWNLKYPEKVFSIPQSYLNAGADIVLTNSFGASPFKLAHYQLRDKTSRINQAAAEISRKAAGESRLVLGSIGPTGVVLMMGDVSQKELYDGFKEQALALSRGGVDALCVETMSALDEAILAIKAIKDHTDLEVICTFTFEKTLKGEYRTMMGVSPPQMVETLLDEGADVVGTNCGNGMKDMIDIVKEIRTVDSDIPILVHANAGRPEVKDGNTIFPESPEEMASYVPEILHAGANIIGGCCGTTPDHIRRIAEKISSYKNNGDT
jgi:5-methyltetrahydrofolate--homocysteine methyltransferase